MSRLQPKFEITPDILLRAYSIGLFPMAESREAANLFWVEPEERGVFPLDRLIVSKRLAKTVRSDRFDIRADHDFEAVIEACADRDKTWINAEIMRLYSELFARGHAHSVEAYEGGELVGGLYGVSLGGAFFGESMFHRRARRLEGRAGPSRRAAAPRRLSPARRAIRHAASRRARRGGDFARGIPAPIDGGDRRDGRFRRLAGAQADERGRGSGARRAASFSAARSGGEVEAVDAAPMIERAAGKARIAAAAQESRTTSSRSR